jgi:hypothetical protein
MCENHRPHHQSCQRGETVPTLSVIYSWIAALPLLVLVLVVVRIAAVDIVAAVGPTDTPRQHALAVQPTDPDQDGALRAGCCCTRSGAAGAASASASAANVSQAGAGTGTGCAAATFA